MTNALNLISPNNLDSNYFRKVIDFSKKLESKYGKDVASDYRNLAVSFYDSIKRDLFTEEFK